MVKSSFRIHTVEESLDRISSEIENLNAGISALTVRETLIKSNPSGPVRAAGIRE